MALRASSKSEGLASPRQCPFGDELKVPKKRKRCHSPKNTTRSSSQPLENGKCISLDSSLKIKKDNDLPELSAAIKIKIVSPTVQK